jgi:malate dehydrogenase
MAESYLLDQKRLLPAAVYCDGEYGIKDLYIGVPAIIGSGGIEKVVEIVLTDEEKGMLGKSVAAVRELVEVGAVSF